MDNKLEAELSEFKAIEPLPIDPEERCDWDFDIGKPPPPKRKWKVQVQLRFKKSESLPIADPIEE